MQARAITCPECDHQLNLGAFDICVCPACHGVWVDEAEVAQAAARASGHPRPTLAVAEDEDEDLDDDWLEDTTEFELVATGPGSYRVARRAPSVAA